MISPFPEILPGGVRIVWHGETLDLLPRRAVFWPRGKTLFAADIHLGKAAAFRLRGIPVPETTHTGDLADLAGLLAATGSENLVILGDLIHARSGKTAEVLAELEQWRARFPDVEIVLVEGNHDRAAGKLPASAGIRISREPLAAGPFLCAHEPLENSAVPVLCGHIHPKFRLCLGRESMTFPCFRLRESELLLPAFGTFCGGHLLSPEPGGRFLLATRNEVVPLPETTAPAALTPNSRS